MEYPSVEFAKRRGPILGPSTSVTLATSTRVTALQSSAPDMYTFNFDEERRLRRVRDLCYEDQCHSLSTVTTHNVVHDLTGLHEGGCGVTVCGHLKGGNNELGARFIPAVAEQRVCRVWSPFYVGTNAWIVYYNECVVPRCERGGQS